MSFEMDCEIKLRKDGMVIVDAQRALLLHEIAEKSSLAQAAKEVDISYKEAMTVLDIMTAAMGAPVVSLFGNGRAELTHEGRSLLSEFQTRSHIARSQVQNLWKKPWVTTDGIILMGDRVVLIKRGREPFKGMHALPGGIIEYGETAEECVVREMEEETGLRTRVLDLVGVYSRVDRDPRGHFITLAFNLVPVGGTLLGGDDAAAAALFRLDELPELAADHRLILSDALLRRGRCASK